MPTKQPWIMGLWKFRDRVSIDELTDYAEKLAEDPRYTQLYVRQTSKDQYGIGFTYVLSEEEAARGPGIEQEYYERVSDTLRRAFGNDLAGWDISTPVWSVK